MFCEAFEGNYATRHGTTLGLTMERAPYLGAGPVKSGVFSKAGQGTARHGVFFLYPGSSVRFGHLTQSSVSRQKKQLSGLQLGEEERYRAAGLS